MLLTVIEIKGVMRNSITLTSHTAPFHMSLKWTRIWKLNCIGLKLKLLLIWQKSSLLKCNKFLSLFVFHLFFGIKSRQNNKRKPSLFICEDKWKIVMSDSLVGPCKFKIESGHILVLVCGAQLLRENQRIISWGK